MIDDAVTIRLLTERIPDLVVAYRYGSTVEGSSHGESDVDLAFLARQSIAAEDRWVLKERLSELLRRPVDLVDLRRAPTVLRMQVVSSGIPLVVVDDVERARFEDWTFSSYARLNEERRAILEQVQREGTVYGR
ncbi:MAG: nucleotidyltransferase domain-containing protein [Candidatus Krumholzibacteriia bacterium]